MNDPERLIAQMLEEADDGDQTITSGFFDGTTSVYHVPSSSSPPSPPRTGAKRRSSSAHHLARPAATPSERRLHHAVRQGQKKAALDDQNRDQSLHPVHSIEILDEESIGDLTDPTSGLPAIGSSPSPTRYHESFLHQHLPHPSAFVTNPSMSLPASRYYPDPVDSRAFSFSSKASTGRLTEVDEVTEEEEPTTSSAPQAQVSTGRPTTDPRRKRKNELKNRTKKGGRCRRCRLCCGLSMCCCVILLIAIGVIAAGIATGFIKGVPFVNSINPKGNASSGPGNANNDDNKPESGKEPTKETGPKFR